MLGVGRINTKKGAFPDGPVVKNPPSIAGMQGTKIPHTAGQLSLSAATTEPSQHN